MRILWSSPTVPDRILDDQKLPWKVRTEAEKLSCSDTPSPSDMRFVFQRYNEATPSERDAMDAVFVWFTGYTLSSIVDRVLGDE